MGIAASQARFLAITSRKANLEFRSMSIAQDKLSITRSLNQVTQKYQNSLNQTKLVWDMDGTTGTGISTGETYDLTYDVMMSPSALNGYSPYFITSRTGKIVLNSKMAKAALNAGIAQDGSTVPSGDKYAAFVKQLGIQGYISTTTVDTLTAKEKIGTNPAGEDIFKYNLYNPEAGIGGEPLDKTQANAMTLSTLISYLEQQSEADETFANKMEIDLTGKTTFVNSSKQTDGNITIQDILTGNVSLVAKDASVAEQQAKEIVDAMVAAFKELFAADVANSEAFEYAVHELNELIETDGAVDVGGSKNAESKVNENSNDYNVWVKSGNTYGISISNLMKSFLTFYAQSIGKYDTPYDVKKRKNESVYVTQDPDYYYIIKNDNAVTEKDLLIADFYSTMFNNICKSGWTTSAGDIDDKDYLSHAIKNGQLFVSSLNTDNTYYQDPYTFNGHIIEVTDEEGIAQAEAEYNKQKSVLNYKEEQLELDMKNVDTELSALTTEYDTVKNLISKNVEKVFTMFSS